ncbi:MAG: hypothetical protein RIQ81_493 [Pseudomonadota bacterium]
MTTRTKKDVIRIGNAGGYWGDDPDALKRQVRGGHLDYISMDFLAEVTMSIMQKQRANDPKLGYARDFLGMLEEVLPDIMKSGTRIITNAGGVNPQGCAEAITALGRKLGLSPRVAIVYGDDILSDIPRLQGEGCDFRNMESGSAFTGVASRIESANIYFGAAPVADALKWEPNIIVTGRVTDTGITIGAMLHEFGWAPTDWDKLAHGVVAGHIIECGTQATGGNFTDWRKVPSFSNMGFPIIEVHRDGTFYVTKHPGSGGLVSTDTVREQLFYEMGNPHSYITPDVVADFATIRLEQAGADRVKVSGIRGYEPTPLYKVSMAYADGFKSLGAIAISGPDARAKAEAFARIFWEKCGKDGLSETSTEYFGWNACHRSLGGMDDGNEILLRLGARSADEKKLRRFGKLIPSLILSGPPGVCVLGGVPKAQEIVSYWPALMPKSAVRPKIAMCEEGRGIHSETVVPPEQSGKFDPARFKPDQVADRASCDIKTAMQIQANPEATALSAICLGRSGDKGDMANIGIMARSAKAYDFLGSYLTAQRVKDLFQELCHGSVTRYALPNMSGFNFLLDEALGGGGTVTLRTDAQGKTFAQALLRHKTLIPKDVLNSVSPGADR